MEEKSYLELISYFNVTPRSHYQNIRSVTNHLENGGKRVSCVENFIDFRPK